MVSLSFFSEQSLGLFLVVVFEVWWWVFCFCVVFFFSFLTLVCVLLVKKWAGDSVLMVLDLHIEPKETVVSSWNRRIT